MGCVKVVGTPTPKVMEKRREGVMLERESPYNGKRVNRRRYSSTPACKGIERDRRESKSEC